MDMPQLAPDFKEFFQLLNSEGVEYLLVGGFAVGYHGYPRTTNDIDVWIAVSPPNAAKTVEALQAFGFDPSNVPIEIFLQEGRIIRMGVPPIRIELLTAISGVEFDDCYARRVETDMSGVRVNVIHLDDLKMNKRASGRPKDMDDLENLP